MQYALKTPPTTGQLLGELLFLQNYLGGVWNHTWSLAVEEHFYIGIALLFACWTKLRPKHDFGAIPIMFAVVGCICFSIRILTAMLHPAFSYWAYLFGTHIRIDSLFFGVLLSYFCIFCDLEKKLLFVPNWVLLSAGCLLLSPAFFFPLDANKWISVVGVIHFYVGSGLILLAALRLPQSPLMPLRFLGVLGASSYSIYLWHMPVNFWGWSLVKRVTGLDSFEMYFVVYIFGSCLFGLVMSRLIEFPALKLRDFLFPSDIHSKSAPTCLDSPKKVFAERIAIYPFSRHEEILLRDSLNCLL